MHELPRRAEGAAVAWLASSIPAAIVAVVATILYESASTSPVLEGVVLVGTAIALVLLLASAWVALIVAAPALPGWAGAVVYGFASLVCHQLPERSFHLQGIQLPVCARCIGLYGGAAAGSVAGAVNIARRWLARRPLLWTRSMKWLATGVAASPTLATFALEWGFGWPMTNGVRAVAALPLGFAVAFVVVSALATVHYE